MICYMSLSWSFCPVLVTWMYESKEWFLLYSLSLLAEKEVMDTCYPSVHSVTVASPNSMEMRKCRGHLQTTLGFEVFSFILLPLDLSLSSPTSFKGRLYLAFVSARLGMTFVPFCDAYQDTVRLLGDTTTRAEKHLFCITL